MEPTETLRKPDRVVARTLEGEAVLLDLESERYFGLDEVGTRMWSELAATGSVTAAFEVLRSEYDVDPAVLRRDLEELASRLVQAGLLERHDSRPISP